MGAPPPHPQIYMFFIIIIARCLLILQFSVLSLGGNLEEFVTSYFLGKFKKVDVTSRTQDVLLATSRDKAVAKFIVLQDFCRTNGMVINQSKTKFMVINGDDRDGVPISSNNVTVPYCTSYVYLGSIITDDGKFSTKIQKHAAEKRKHLNKFKLFLKKNPDVPFVVKEKVFHACVISTFIYGCESWFFRNIDDINYMYMEGIKAMLNVRETTANDTCLVEIGYPSLKALIRDKQQKYYQKYTEDRERLFEDPLGLALSLARTSNLNAHRYMNAVKNEQNIIANDIEIRKDRLRNAEGTKFKLYVEMNPELSKHKLYEEYEVNDSKRVDFSRFRLSSHRLKVETGRWARIDRNRRLCSCSANIQDEHHVLRECALSEEVRNQYLQLNMNIPEIFNSDHNTMTDFFSKLLKIYK